MSRFCCFSMTKPNPTDASQSECPYFGKAGFTEIFLGADSRKWCALHAPNAVHSSDVGNPLPNQTETLRHAIAISFGSRTGILDLRRTFWPAAFDFGALARAIGTHPLKCIDFSEAVFSQSFSWRSGEIADQVIFSAAQFLADSSFQETSQELLLNGSKFEGPHLTENPKNSINYSDCKFLDTAIIKTENAPPPKFSV